MSDIDIVAVDSLKALDPKRPIREADMRQPARHVRLVPEADILQRENVPTARAEAYYANWHEWSASEQN